MRGHLRIECHCQWSSGLIPPIIGNADLPVIWLPTVYDQNGVAKNGSQEKVLTSTPALKKSAILIKGTK